MYPYEETVKPGKIEFLINFSYIGILSAVLLFIFRDWQIFGLIIFIWLFMILFSFFYKNEVQIEGDELIVKGKKFEDRMKISDISEVCKCFIIKSKYNTLAVPYKRSDSSEITRMKIRRVFGVYNGIIVRMKDGTQHAVPTHEAGELMNALGFPQYDE